MRKISEMDMQEFPAVLCKIAPCAERLFSDKAVCDAFDKMGEYMKEGQTAKTGFSLFALLLIPVLMNEKHIEDTYSILAAIEGVDVQKMKKLNGVKTTGDMFRLFVLDGSVQGIFRPGSQIRCQ